MSAWRNLIYEHDIPQQSLVDKRNIFSNQQNTHSRCKQLYVPGLLSRSRYERKPLSRLIAERRKQSILPVSAAAVAYYRPFLRTW